MIEVRPFASLGGANHGWLDAKHHFAFGGYRDAARMGWGSLRVWNDDTIAAQNGLPPQPHSDMEIITYVRQGAIAHKDNLGNAGRTADSEYNLESDITRIFQIWTLPANRGAPPTWGANPFPKGERSGRFVTLASGIDGNTDALTLRSDARVADATTSIWCPPPAQSRSMAIAPKPATASS